MISRQLSGLVAVALLAASPQVVAQIAPPPGTTARARSTTAPVQGGFTATPFVSLSTTYDDNLFLSTTNRQSDTILSVAPGALLDYHSRRTDFNLLYSFSADKFFHHSDLDSLVDEQQGTIGLHHQFTRRLELGFTGGYFVTHSPGQLSPESGLIVGRNRATNTTLQPELAYDLSATSSMRLSYLRSWRNIATGDKVQIGTAAAAYTNRFSERNAIQFTLQNVSYNFSNDGSPTSNILTAGWTHDFSPTTSITLGGGPRVTEGNVKPEVLASLNYASRRTTFALTYQRTQTVVIGETEPLETRSISAAFGFTPARHFTIGFSPSYHRNNGASITAKGWNLGFYTWYRFAPAWSLGLTYSYEHQRETVNGGPSGTIQRNLVSLTLRWQLPSRGSELQIVPPPTAGPGPGPRGG
ncbi:MAG: hypothetical protein ACRD06_06165 [Terriglobia bacterium]